MRGSFAGEVRKIIAGSLGEISISEIADRLGIALPKTKKRLYTTIRDLLRAGEIERRGEGVYAWKGKARKPDRREVMWRILRARRFVTVEDLQEMAGVSRDYAREWLRMILKKEIVRKERSGYRLVSDPVEMPENTEKTEKLRDLRKRMAQAAALLRQAAQTLEGSDR